MGHERTEPCPNCGKQLKAERKEGSRYWWISCDGVCGWYTLGCDTVAEAWQELEETRDGLRCIVCGGDKKDGNCANCAKARLPCESFGYDPVPGESRNCSVCGEAMEPHSSIEGMWCCHNKSCPICTESGGAYHGDGGVSVVFVAACHTESDYDSGVYGVFATQEEAQDCIDTFGGGHIVATKIGDPEVGLMWRVSMDKSGNIGSVNAIEHMRMTDEKVHCGYRGLKYLELDVYADGERDAVAKVDAVRKRLIESGEYKQ